MNELKPRPFCGGKIDKCGADVCFYGAEHEPKASKAWNRRKL